MVDEANFVQILHDDGTTAIYAHLQLDTVRVRPGQRVRPRRVHRELRQHRVLGGPAPAFPRCCASIGMETVSVPVHVRGTAAGASITLHTGDYDRGELTTRARASRAGGYGAKSRVTPTLTTVPSCWFPLSPDCDSGILRLQARTIPAAARVETAAAASRRASEPPVSGVEAHRRGRPGRDRQSRQFASRTRIPSRIELALVREVSSSVTLSVPVPRVVLAGATVLGRRKERRSSIDLVTDPEIPPEYQSVEPVPRLDVLVEPFAVARCIVLAPRRLGRPSVR
jgi:hypothetical protein